MDDQDKLRGLNVLVVDDDPRNTFAMVNYLEYCGSNVLVAEDGFKALEALAANGDTVDIVLMDMMMPEMDGYETIRRIKNDLSLNEIPIIAVTAKAMVGDREKCLEAGASEYVAKPVDLNVLNEAIYGLVNK